MLMERFGREKISFARPGVDPAYELASLQHVISTGQESLKRCMLKGQLGDRRSVTQKNICKIAIN